ncbi:F-box/LRR-repeat protein At4g14096-like [Vicia villosa]|uniref:F-box/LRR-repeat protein At4g14096-like n=1 Tax=Vicia villosa TaxID=3911 RepID=UPI00273AC9FB|nr:F-box/LRR-repeat protein At4g14096-like [Vicia villosa]
MVSETIIERLEHIENKDRISDLPESVLLHILSFLKTTQYTVQTCILSKRWKNLWKQFSVLSLHSDCFNTLEVFIEYVSQLLSLRDHGIPLHTLKLFLSPEDNIESHLFERILTYAVSNNVKNLQVLLDCDIQHFPSSLLSCHTLTSLYFRVFPSLDDEEKILFPNSLNFQSLTKLDIGCIAFCGGTDPFSACPRLIWLKISNFNILGDKNLCISSTTLVKLTIQIHCKPKNDNKMELSIPSLRTFAFIGTPFKILYASQLTSVEHIEIDAYMGRKHHAEAPSILLSWLLELANIKILTVSSNTLRALSLVPDLLKVKLHTLYDLKKLKVKMKKLDCGLSKALSKNSIAHLPAKSDEEIIKLIVEFLLQNSASTEVCYFKGNRRCD